MQKNINLSTQKRILVTSVFLLIAKFGAYLLTNSAGILTDALESIVNVIAGVITLVSLAYALKPKDSNHPFGHGKIESVSASLEGILIFFAGVMIIVEGVNRLFHPSELRQLDIGIWIVAIAGLINYLLGAYSIYVGKHHNSIALIAGGKHLQSDTYSSIGLVAGLLLLYFTGLQWIDSALAITFGIIIGWTGVNILRTTIDNLLDKSDDETINKIVNIINSSDCDNWVDIHNLKVIKYGNIYHLDCDITLPWYMDISDGHKEAEDLEKLIADNIKEEIIFSIHFDPCKDYQCINCRKKVCPHRCLEFKETIKLTHGMVISNEEEHNEIKRT